MSFKLSLSLLLKHVNMFFVCVNFFLFSVAL